jgi:hypothetical protein
MSPLFSSEPPLGLPELDENTAIGILVAIAGNIIISLALNLQKLSHRRRDLANAARLEDTKPAHRQFSRGPHGGMERVREMSGEGQGDEPLLDQDHWTDNDPTVHQSPMDLESPQMQPPLLPRATSYGSSANAPTKNRKPALSLLYPKPRSSLAQNSHPLPTRIVTSETTHLLSSDLVSPGPSSGTSSKRSPSASIIENGNESDYLKSKVWCVILLLDFVRTSIETPRRWAGFLLMNVCLFKTLFYP